MSQRFQIRQINFNSPNPAITEKAADLKIKDEDRLSPEALKHRAEYNEKRHLQDPHYITREMNNIKEYWNGEYWDTQEAQAFIYKGQNAAICAKAKMLKNVAIGLHGYIHVRNPNPKKHNAYTKKLL